MLMAYEISWETQCQVNYIIFGLAYQGKDIMFRFIIEYNSLMDFGPYVVRLFLYEYFWKMIFWHVETWGQKQK